MKRLTFALPALAALILAAAFVCLNSANLAKNPCVEIRAGFDVGSGSTKMLVAEVDTCSKKLLKSLADTSEKIEFQEDLNSSKANELSEQIKYRAIQTLSSMKAQAVQLGATRFKGVATQAFRAAKNGAAFVDEVSQASQVPVSIITQEEETALGRLGVGATIKGSINHIAVWDIGGGSQEFSVPSKTGAMVGFETQIASVGFRDLVIEKVKSQNAKQVKTPNPLNADEIEHAIRLSKEIAGQVDEQIRVAIDQPGIEVIGIGGVHWHSIRGQTGQKDVYYLSDIEAALKANEGKSDSQISSKFADTEVTNLAFVFGHMANLGIRKVRPMKVNLALGCLF